MGLGTNILTFLQIVIVIYFGFNALNLKVFLGDEVVNKIDKESVVFSIRSGGDVIKERIISEPIDFDVYELKVSINEPISVCIEDLCTTRNIKVNQTHYQRNFTFNIINGNFTSEYSFHLHNGIPYPFHNQFYHLYSTMSPISSDLVNIKLSVYNISFYKYTLFLHYSASFNELRSVLQEKDIDQFKSIFIDTNFYYLLLTLSVSVLHSILDFFAFKNDVLFWKKKKKKADFKGLSVSAVFVNIICQIIILFYLIDTGKTNSVIIASSVAQLAIELWKCSKLVNLEHISWKGFSWSIQQDDITLHYDKMAFKYMSVVVGPILIAYAVYSVLYDSFSNNYSLFIKIMASFVYGFQFIIMTPQLFINYHLKSVSHLPFRMLTYRFLGTIVDDLFAFIIEMPTLHRIACFRDDVIFVIAIYQAYLYPVDKSRVNEYGQSFETHEKTYVDKDAESDGLAHDLTETEKALSSAVKSKKTRKRKTK
eukprot:NODE_135_length_18075_cov_0.518413.p4 type:complete len:480 gc:universal NODE_135_length_18075_cov_0.518413:17345-15906(-)